MISDAFIFKKWFLCVNSESFQVNFMEAKLIELSIDPIFTDFKSGNIYPRIRFWPSSIAHQFLWLIYSKVCPCSCDSGEIIGAPDGFTFALIAQQGTVSNWLHMIEIKVKNKLNKFYISYFANKILSAVKEFETTESATLDSEAQDELSHNFLDSLVYVMLPVSLKSTNLAHFWLSNAFIEISWNLIKFKLRIR